MAAKTRAGVTGSAVRETSRSRRASQTALAMAPLSPGLPHSPRPRSPSRFMPPVASFSQEGPAHTTPLGLRALGEGGNPGLRAAIAHALCDAPPAPDGPLPPLPRPPARLL